MADSYSLGKQAVRANRAFYDAFQALDLGAMGRAWLDRGPQGPPLRCVHPGSAAIVGRERVLDSWRVIFGATDAIRFELADLAVEVHGEVACVTCVERIVATAGGLEQHGEAVATNLFVRDGGQWRMVLHHASPVVRQME